MMAHWVYLSVVAGLFICYSVYFARANARARRVRLSRFSSRESLDPQTWYERNFADAGIDRETAVAIFDPIARAVGCGLTQLRGDDGFETSLAFDGVSFLGVEDGDDLGDFAEFELPEIVGSEERAMLVVERMQGERTLHALARAVAASVRT